MEQLVQPKGACEPGSDRSRFFSNKTVLMNTRPLTVGSLRGRQGRSSGWPHRASASKPPASFMASLTMEATAGPPALG
jgi:hypothetical protein